MKFNTLDKKISLIISPFINICLVILLISQSIVFSQVKDNSPTKNQAIDDESNIFTTGPTNCESLLAELDTELYSKQELEKDSKVIIIFRLNKSETQKHYNTRKKQLSNWFENRYPKRVVYAKGDVISDDLGRADIYFNGKKVSIIKFNYKFMGVCSGENPYWILK